MVRMWFKQHENMDLSCLAFKDVIVKAAAVLKSQKSAIVWCFIYIFIQ